MKQVVLALLLSAVNCIAGDSEQFTSKQILDLIHSLPGYEQIEKDFALTGDTTQANGEQSEARARLKKAAEGFNRLRSLLRVGTSVFDYPGLLALSPSRYIEFDHKYAIMLGIPSEEVRANGEGPEENAFDVIFDNRGIITEIQPVRASQ